MAWSNGNSRTSTAEWKRIREWAKRNLTYRCQQPGCEQDEGLELDHIVPVSQGGTDDPENLAWMCPPHHMAKTQREAAARRGPYRRKPKPPLGGTDKNHS